MRLLPALLLASTVALAQAPQKRPMTFADLEAMKRVSDPQISPSGKWVLFSVTDVSLEKNTKTNHLWIVPLSGGTERQLTFGSGESSGRFSSDGKSVMYSAGDQLTLAAWDDAQGDWAQPLQTHAITALETGADGAIWAPDSKHILFTSSVYPACESKTPQRAAEEANCNALKDTLAANSPVKAQIFTTLLYRHWNAYQGAKHSHIFYASIDGSAPTDLTPASVIGDHEAPTFSLGGPLGYAISPDGKEIAYVTNLDKVPAESTNNDIFVLQVGADPATAKKVSTSPGSDDGPQYSPDGKYLAWRSQARNGYESDKFDLVVMDRAAAKMSNLTTTFGGWVNEFVWTDGDFVFTSSFEGEESVYLTDFKSDALKRPATVAKGAEYGSLQNVAAVHTLIGPTLIATKMNVDSPSEIVVIQPSDSFLTHVGPDKQSITDSYGVSVIGHSQEKILTHFNDNLLVQLDLSKMESFWFPGANNTKVQGFLIRPPNFDSTKRYPLKFLIHGGPQGAWGDAWSYRWNPELFAANGYVVVMINPRGSTGYGQKFLEEVSGDWGGRPYVDLMKGLDYAEKTYPFIDRTRECALGASYGGFMADFILTHTGRFACIVTHDGMYNPQSAFGTTEELWFNEWEFRPLAGARVQGPGASKNNSHGAPATELSSRPERGAVERPAGKPGDNPDATVEQTTPAHPWDFYNLPASEDPFRKFSPMLSIQNAKTPTLVIHGQKDYRLDVSEGLQLFTALQLRGIPSKMLYFPDEGHWVLKPQNSQLWYTTVNDWVDQWTHTNAYATKTP